MEISLAGQTWNLYTAISLELSGHARLTTYFANNKPLRYSHFGLAQLGNDL
jgi:hypothetical protein